jgi:hypothetical protein
MHLGNPYKINSEELNLKRFFSFKKIAMKICGKFLEMAYFLGLVIKLSVSLTYGNTKTALLKLPKNIYILKRHIYLSSGNKRR